MLDTDLKDNYFGGIKAIGAESIRDYIIQLGLDIHSYINSGFLLINAKLQREKQLFDKIQEYLTKNFNFKIKIL